MLNGPSQFPRPLGTLSDRYRARVTLVFAKDGSGGWAGGLVCQDPWHISGLSQSPYRLQRCDLPINNPANVFSDVMYRQCIRKTSEDRYTPTILSGRIVADVDLLHGLYQPLEMKTELTCSLTRLTARGRTYYLGPDLETLKIVKECDPIGGGASWLIKPQNNLRMLSSLVVSPPRWLS